MLLPNWQAPSNIKAVTICRNESMSNLLPNETPEHMAWLTQIHSNLPVEIDSKLFNNTTPYVPFTADASYTKSVNIACVVKTADCLPILITSKDGQWIAAIHAGWRGLANNIIENTVAKFYHQDPSNKNSSLMAWLGPAISKKHFEVGQDVYNTFVDNNNDDKEAFTQSIHYSNKWFADLYLLAKQRLNRLNINSIFTDNYCTYEMSKQFYSYRRDNQTPDRLITMIWKTQQEALTNEIN